MSITECLKEFLNNEETRKDFAREEWEARKNQAIGEERGIKIGEEIGRELGHVETANNIALNLLKMKTDIKNVTDCK